jgi:PBSX family phage terminase large subunit
MPKQLEFFNDREHKYLLFLGGFGSGKSFALLNKCIHTCLVNQGSNIGLVAPQLSMQKRIHIPDILKFLQEYGIEHKYFKQDKYFQIGPKKNPTNLYLYSGEEPDRIAGLNATAFFIDEIDLMRKDAAYKLVNQVSSRIRVLAPINQICMSSTPEGFKFLYEFFEVNAAPDRRIIRGRTYDNYHVPPTYADDLRKVFTEQQVNAYLNGEFVNMSGGSVYNNFQVINQDFDETKTLHVGVDFNVDNTAAVIIQKFGEKYVVVAEVTKCKDTHHLVETMKEKYAGKQIIWYPDASGAQRKSSAMGQTDNKILLSYPNSSINTVGFNPLIKDRVNTVNYNFRNNILTLSNNAPVLLDALKRQTYDSNQLPDKTSGLDHPLDALGYAIFRLSPMPTINHQDYVNIQHHSTRF